jgi:maltooligosyltrehalose trehalohydrolase
MLAWTIRLIQLRKTIPSLGAGDAKTQGHTVWVYDGEQVLVVYRWAREGPSMLLVLGFNKSRVTISLREPEGLWQLSMDSGAKQFGGTGQDSFPPSLALSPQGTPVKIPAYAAALFISS